MFQLIICIIALLVQSVLIRVMGSNHCEESNMSGYNNQSDDIFCNFSIKHDLLPVLIMYISSGTVSGIVCIIVIALMTFFHLYAQNFDR